MRTGCCATDANQQRSQHSARLGLQPGKKTAGRARRALWCYDQTNTRPGLLYRLSDTLSAAGLNIDHLQTEQLRTKRGAPPLFNTQCHFCGDKRPDVPSLRAGLQKLEAELGITLASVYERLEDIDADNAEARAAQLLSGLGFDKDMQNKPTREYSGGWRMRLLLAQVMMRNADVLLLDEPTNHLDVGARPGPGPTLLGGSRRITEDPLLP